MFFYLSKLLPEFIYPLGLACLLLAGTIIFIRDVRWSRRLCLLTLLLLVLGGNRIVTSFIIHSLEKQYPPLKTIPSADVIVVLGGGTRHQSPPRLEPEINEAGDRVLYAARLYHAGVAPIILVSGGHADWTGPAIGAETESMVDLLKLAGVPESAILSESISSNTYENGVQTVAILHKLHYKKVILVTSAIHMPRAVGVFQKYDLELIPAPTDFLVIDQDMVFYSSPDLRIQLMNLIPSADKLALTTRALKEYFGIMVYRLRGWI
jgi:uncharacterized SAM-binding protein YcdF (DUF218 family)